MSELIQPEWLQGHLPTTGGSKWVKGMKSPNPAGRPRGIVDKRSKLSQKMLGDAQAIIDKMIAQALDGDAQAASLILSRIMPTLRAQAERVEFDFDASAPVTQQVEQVLQAISEGKVAADVGRQIIEAIGALSAVRAVDELERRLQALEDKQ